MEGTPQLLAPHSLEKTETYDYIVLGAGVAGLAFAYKIAEGGKSVLVLEREKQIGGLSRTFEHGGFKFDLCGHRFHSADETLLKEIVELVGPSFKKHAQKTRIYMFDKYLKYPFELSNLLRAMPPLDAIHAAVSFLLNLAIKRIRDKRMSSYKDWFVYNFGNKLYTIMCLPYARKIWKTDPSNISADWADERFRTFNVNKLIHTTLGKLVRLDFSPYSLEDESLAPDAGEFYYGETGAHEIPDGFSKRLAEMKCSILTNVRLAAISAKARRVEYGLGDKQVTSYARDAIVSTIPLHTCYALGGAQKARIDTALKGLKYMDIICVYLFLNKQKVSNDHWLYFPDEGIIFNRSVEFRTMSTRMTPPGKTALCLDVTCFEGDKIWTRPDSDLVASCIASAERLGLLVRDEVLDSLVLRVKYAYPVYDLAYKTKLREVVEFLERDETLFCLGRTGIFRYNNTDNSIEMGFELARRLLEDRKQSLIDYTIAHISY